MKKPIYIYGAGGLGREVLSLIRQLEGWDPKAFVDDVVTEGTIINGLVVVKDISRIPAGSEVVVAIGDPLVKSRIVANLGNRFGFPVLIHPRALLQEIATISIGAGSVITANVVVTCNVTIGEHVLINLASTIGHDSRIGAFSSIMPGVNVAGQVDIGEAVLIGAGSNIRNRIVIGRKSIVGMGAVVIRDVSDETTVAGVPAQPIRRSS